MVFVDEGCFIDKPAGVITKISLKYVAQEDDDFKAMDGKEALWVKSYDAKLCMLIAFVRNDGGLSSYNIQGGGGGTPEEIYKLAMEKGGSL